MSFEQSDINRFFDKTIVSIVNSYNNEFCLEWTVSCNQYGYGYFRYNGKMHKAHRIAWMIKWRYFR